jgi:hypothetical protein
MSWTGLAGFFSIMMITGGLGWAQCPTCSITARQTRGIVQTAPVIENICVESIQNLSHQRVNIEGIDDELVAQLQKVGFQANRISAPDTKRCDAVVNAELVDITGRGRKSARVDFRLTLAGEEPPRISASAHGKSPKSAPMAAPVALNFRPMEFASSQRKPDRTGTEREAIAAALADQAHQIKVAYQHGLPPWLPAVE